MKKPLINVRVMAVLLLSFSSGLPLALVGSVLQAWYTVAGIDLMTIGLLTMVGQPYLYKFVWAPLMDRFSPLKLGRRRSWILLMQLGVVCGLVLMAMLHPKTHPFALATLALLTAFFSASQDTAIDAYRTDVLFADERGMGASMTNLGYRIAMIVSGAFSFILASKIGWHATYLVMAAIMGLNAIVTFKAPNPKEPAAGELVSLRAAIIEPFQDFMKRGNAVLLLLFMLLYKICDAFALSLNTTFLIRGIGFSLISIGSITKIVGLVGALLGSIVGGIWLSRLGLYRALMWFGFFQMTSNLSFSALVLIGKNYTVMASSIFLDYFCGGLSSVAIIVFLMGLCNQRYTATQYALFSALMAVSRTLIGPIAAVVVEHVGWFQFYIWSFFIGLPALLILYGLKNRIDFSDVNLMRATEYP